MKKAIFTMVREEYFMLPKWYNYYSQTFNDKDIYIIHHKPHGSEDTCVDKYKNCNIIVETHPYFDGNWFTATFEALQKKLLKTYDITIFTDIDEIIIPKQETTLEDFLNNIPPQTEVVRCMGYEIWHDPDKEQDFDENKSIMSQRNYWYRSDIYDKYAVSKVPIKYTTGHHDAYRDEKVNENLIMLHLHKYDKKDTLKDINILPHLHLILKV